MPDQHDLMAFVEARTGHCVNSHERLINVTLDFADTRDRYLEG